MTWLISNSSLLTQKNDSGCSSVRRHSILRVSILIKVLTGLWKRISLRKYLKTRIQRNWFRLLNRYRHLISNSRLFRRRCWRQVKICCVWGGRVQGRLRRACWDCFRRRLCIRVLRSIRRLKLIGRNRRGRSRNGISFWRQMTSSLPQTWKPSSFLPHLSSSTK